MLKKNINQLVEDGVTIIKGAYSIEKINELKSFSQELHLPIKNLLNNPIESEKCKSIYKYETHFDIERTYYKNCYTLNNIQAIEIVKGRYDISYLECQKELNLKVQEIINHFMKPDNRSYTWGLLTSSTQSDNGHWHRDTVNINGDADKEGNYDDSPMVYHLKPFYFTVLIPLVPLNKENGTPEFIRGSHRMTYRDTIGKEHLRMDTELGDIIIFDGRIFHRGCANHSEKARPVLYNMIHRDWYVESGK